MARMIDAGSLRDNITDIYGGSDRLIYLADVLSLIDAQPTLTPPNEPLTLDELREMDGEPVWGKSLITDKPGEWFILRVVEMSKTWFIACAGAEQGFGDKDTYGKTWLAYHRPRWTEQEVEDAKNIIRMFGEDHFTHVAKDENGWPMLSDSYEDCMTFTVGLEKNIFPSLKPDQTVKLTDIIGGNT